MTVLVVTVYNDNGSKVENRILHPDCLRYDYGGDNQGFALRWFGNRAEAERWIAVEEAEVTGG